MKKDNCAISIIVPVYNAEKYLDRCLRSIYSQTFTDYEIILVNDGSKDNSLALCRAYAGKDPRITVIDKENGGAGSARNKGIEIAKGEYLAFPDVDDWFEPKMYEDLYKLAKKGDYDIVFSGENNFSQDLRYINTLNYESKCFETRKECMDNIMFFFPTTLLFDSPCNKLYKTATVRNNNIFFPNLKRCQDAVFNLEIYNCANSVAAIDKAYYNYINNDKEKVNIKFPRNYIDINIAYYSRLKEIMSDYGIYKGAIKEHYDSSFVLSVYETLNMFDNPRWGFSKSDKRKYVLNILGKSEIMEFLSDPILRENVLVQYEIIKNKDINKIFKLHKREKVRGFLKRNALIMYIFHKIKNRFSF